MARSALVTTLPRASIDPMPREALSCCCCPVCLRKLMLAVGFDPEARYQALQAFYTERGMRSEAAWVQQRLAEIGGA